MGRARPAPIRPPGAREEAEFLAACIRCGQCVQVCPQDALQWDNDGIFDRGTPFVAPRDKACTLCLERAEMPCVAVCPSDALQTVEDRADVRMGTAEIDVSICLAYNGATCRACWHACPYPGTALAYDRRLRPVVDADVCTGCGLCEYACLTEEPSIRVRPRPDARRAG